MWTLLSYCSKQTAQLTRFSSSDPGRDAAILKGNRDHLALLQLYIVEQLRIPAVITYKVDTK